MSSSDKHILVTGGAGYIGGHTVVELLTGGWKVVVLDNFRNSNKESLNRIKEITGKDFIFEEVDLCNEAAVDALFVKYPISSVIHFAGLKAVGESNQMPIEYYDNNITGTLYLLKAMKKYNVKDLVFSSSATVYGEVTKVPITEDFPLSATNPYGKTKLFIEEILRDVSKSDKAWNIILLRYFNPVGAHPSGRIGEDPKGAPNNLTPYITQVAVGRREFVSVFGNDYKTKDGTGVRDYIHVVDLAKGHIAAVKKLAANPGCVAYNLGTGVGYSVLEMIEAVKKVSGKDVPFKFCPRRPGDIGECFADVSLAQKELGWKAEFGNEEMIRDAWNWQSKNPNGFSS
eukprot:TRINITY_DN10487_c0_g1_i1.p1 TRINITY_DN10487_c0_g1~~TRINITY_DN10487_c0_g1_i1.p1  ORF type:complete len:384 (-),score=114.10 TRINITY_DN10487_c0_g1_i1:105-1133(-)